MSSVGEDHSVENAHSHNFRERSGGVDVAQDGIACLHFLLTNVDVCPFLVGDQIAYGMMPDVRQQNLEQMTVDLWLSL